MNYVPYYYNYSKQFKCYSLCGFWGKMISVRQIETVSATFYQYDNGVNEIIYHESSKEAVDKFVYFVDMVVQETPTDDTVYILCNLSKTWNQPLDYHYAQIKKLDSKHAPSERRYTRLANLYPQMTKTQEMVLAYMRSLDLPRVKLNMFAVDDYQKAVSWLLSGL